MLSIRKILFVTAIALGVAATDRAAKADGPGCSGPGCGAPRFTTFGSFLFQSHNKALPTFQAAPWYLYWPYDGHFLAPAPIHAPFYGPPTNGNFPVNPYFPAPAGAYGPIPGGPIPGGVPVSPAGYGYGGIPQPMPPVMAPRQ